MVFRKTISAEQKALAVCLRKECNFSYNMIAAKCGIAKSSAQRIVTCASLVRERTVLPKMGRPKKLQERHKRMFIRTLKKTRASNVNFTLKQLVKESGLNMTMASKRTFYRCLREHGYHFLQARQKGLVTVNDRKKRIIYAREMTRHLLIYPNFWKEDIAFYLDAVSFIHKGNPMSEASSPKARVWRKKGEGLQVTAKGSKNLAGGRRLHILVAIAYGKGVILKEIFEKMNAAFFSQFIKDNFNSCFAQAGPKKNGKRLFVMDNDPSQNSKASVRAMKEIKAGHHKIPPRSPDLNPIENIFHVVKNSLAEEAISCQITKETFEDFKNRVLHMFTKIEVKLIDKTIESMPNRIQAVLDCKGYRTKY